MAAPVTPLGDRVLVKPAEPIKVTSGGVVIPEHIEEKPRMGVVLAVGEGLVNQDGTRTAPTVEEGQTVLFSQFAGVDVELTGTHYLILREGDILGIVDAAALEAAA